MPAHTPPGDGTQATAKSVFALERTVYAPPVRLSPPLSLDTRLQMDGLAFLEQLPLASFPVVFLDPQYRGVLDKLAYGNEGRNRGQARYALPQMAESQITQFIRQSAAVLIPSGHLFLWMDKFHLCTGFRHWLRDTELEVVDLITWHKKRMGMGYRSRRTAEYLVILQKKPRRAKGVWQVHTIPDVWTEAVARNGHTHTKPIGLQGALIAAVSHPGDVVVDPAAGSFSVMAACQAQDRRFLGCDING